MSLAEHPAPGRCRRDRIPCNCVRPWLRDKVEGKARGSRRCSRRLVRVGAAHAPSPDAHSAHPGLRSLDAGCAAASMPPLASNAGSRGMGSPSRQPAASNEASLPRLASAFLSENSDDRKSRSETASRFRGAPARGRQRSPLRGPPDCRRGEDPPKAPRAFTDPLAHPFQGAASSPEASRIRSSQPSARRSRGPSCRCRAPRRRHPPRSPPSAC